MKASSLQSYRLPTGELVLSCPSADLAGEGPFDGLVGFFLQQEIVGFAFALVSALCTLWILAG